MAEPRGARQVSGGFTWLAPVVLMLLFVTLSAGTYALWESRDVYALAGDEPHYLGMTRGLVEEQTLDQLVVLALEQSDPVAFADASIPLPPNPDPVAFQSIETESGWQSIHSPGLPALLAVPYIAGGVDWARAALVLLAALCVPLVWWTTRLLGGPRTPMSVRVATTGAITLTAPLIFSAGQVYPDIAAGLALLLGMTVLLAGERLKHTWVRYATVVALSTTPWLQLKFALPALVVLLALAIQWRLHHRAATIAAILIPGGSLAVMGLLHLTLYGTALGPYSGGGLELSATSLMVFTGLALDQNHGALLLSPVLWAALPGIVLLWRARWRYAGVLLVVIVTAAAPNAAHPNWYGGGSFVGRFTLPAILLLSIPAAVGLLALARSVRWLFWTVIAIVALVLVWMWTWFALVSGIPSDGTSSGLALYNRPQDTWLGTYSILWYPFERWLPALYDSDWAYGFAPNAAWIIIALGIIALTIAWPHLRRRRLWLGLSGVAALGLIAVSGVIGGAVSTPATATGVPVTITTAQTPLPQVRQFVRHGDYALELTVVSPFPVGDVVGRWELFYPETGDVFRSGEIRGTGGEVSTLREEFAFRALTPTLIEARVVIPPSSGVTIKDLRITDQEDALSRLP